MTSHRRAVLATFGVAFGGSSLAGCVTTTGDDREPDPLEGTIRTTQYDAGNSGVTAASGPSDPELRWATDVNDRTGQPLLSEGAFVCRSPETNDERLQAIDSVDGKPRWEARGAQEIDGTGVIADGTLITHRYDLGSDDHELVAFDLATLHASGGSDDDPDDAILWRSAGEHRLYGQPVAAGGVVYAATTEAVYAVAAETGDREWTVDLRPSTPVAADDAGVFVGTLDGDLVRLVDGDRRFGVPLDGEATAPPTVVDGSVLVGDVHGTIRAVDRDGSTHWKREGLGPIYGSPAVDDGVAYVPRFAGYVQALALADGEERWRFDPGGDHRRTFVTDATRTPGAVYVASDDGRLYAISEGEARWVIDLEAHPVAGPLVADGAVAVVTADHELRVYDGGDPA
ncbi:hypothetical protein CV102_02390 [Natronococcus pandeyae]|uniref:Pyrrolo-quinoline quinone repeat domain-containing protein n=1 Tax=Natronococcus pandeyae TaxID=2055836 RepID=A0A8J8Q7B8_9EURY|nr:PQQ-binding-like beta-propeller repeat protein [Natronococcus pandeyae]TYL40442.1 hypothetical protein CV102_02390 [Natronococcus pandeyae]